MEALTCRSARACATCEHADRFGGCQLEDAIAQALAPNPVEARRARVHLRLETSARRQDLPLGLLAEA